MLDILIFFIEAILPSSAALQGLCRCISHIDRLYARRVFSKQTWIVHYEGKLWRYTVPVNSSPQRSTNKWSPSEAKKLEEWKTSPYGAYGIVGENGIGKKSFVEDFATRVHKDVHFRRRV